MGIDLSKSSCIKMCFLFAFLTLILFIPATVAQADAADELADILEQGIGLAEDLAAKGLLVEHLELDLLGQGETYSLNYAVSPGGTYLIVGLGGTGIADLDIHAYDQDGNLMAYDVLEDEVPIVVVESEYQGDIYIELTVHELASGFTWAEPYYFMLIIASQYDHYNQRLLNTGLL